MVMLKRIQEPKEVSKHRVVLRNCNRKQLEITASHTVLYTRFKERLYTLPSVKIDRMQKEIRKDFFFKTDEDLRKMIFEYDFPGYVWRK